MKELSLNIFEYNDYRAYLLAIVGPASQRRGLKQKISKALGVQASFISAVLNDKQNLSLEQAFRLSEFMGQDKDEAEYFLALVQMARAGSIALRKHFVSQAEAMREKRMTVQGRLGQKTIISEEDHVTYYSSWEYGAVHIAMSIPRMRELEALGRALKIDRDRLAEILRFLDRCGALVRNGDGINVSTPFHRLARDSQYRFQHHTNWRLKAIDSVRRETPKDLHFSGVYSLSSKDALVIKDQILASLKQHESIIKASPEEELYCYGIDWYSLDKGQN